MAHVTNVQAEAYLLTGGQEPRLRAAFGDGLYDALRVAARRARESRAARTRSGPKVLILPGLLGSSLERARWPLPDRLWPDPMDLSADGIGALALPDPDRKVTASGTLPSTCLLLKLQLECAGFDAEFLPYDWRRSIAEESAHLMDAMRRAGVTGCILVAQGMGGLIARGLCALDPDHAVVARAVTIGTPNRGTYTPARMLAGDHALPAALARLEGVDDEDGVIRKTLRTMPALPELLPAPDARPDENWFDRDFWPKRLRRNLPTQRLMDAAAAARAALAPPDGRFLQIVGVGRPTATRAAVDGGGFIWTEGDGDGMTPRDLAEMGDGPHYYAVGAHPWLCNRSDVIGAVIDLAGTGRTDALGAAPPDADMAAPRSAPLPRARSAPQAAPATGLERAALAALGAFEFTADPDLPPPPPPVAAALVRADAEAGESPDAAFDLSAAAAAARNWQASAKRRAAAARRAAKGGDVAAEDAARIQTYALRLQRGLAALPQAERRAMPAPVRDMMDAAARSEGTDELARALVNERMIGAVENFLSVMFIKRAALAARPVGRIVEWPNIRSMGTGFLIAPGVLMTNHHVLRSARDAALSAVQFDFELDIRQRENPGALFQFDPQRLFLSDRALDYAVVAVAPVGEDGARIETYGHLPLIGETGKVRVGQPVNIIQHPRGRRKEVVFRESVLHALPTDPDTVLQYTGDTEPGSSGSPVFNDWWEVVALHHSAVPKVDENGLWVHRSGPPRPEREADQSDVVWVANEGIRVSRLTRSLEDRMEAAPPGSPARAALETVFDAGRAAARAPLGIGAEAMEPPAPTPAPTPAPGGAAHVASATAIPGGAVTVEVTVRIAPPAAEG